MSWAKTKRPARPRLEPLEKEEEEEEEEEEEFLSFPMIGRSSRDFIIVYYFVLFT